MSTLTEIETAADRLPLAQQEELLRHIEANLRRKQSGSGSIARADWIRRLNSLRASIGSNTPMLSGEQILAELRED